VFYIERYGLIRLSKMTAS